MINYDLVMIKEKYGERMMHLCRELFPTLLEQEGQLFDLLRTNFSYSKFLYEDIINNSLEDKFKNYIYGLIETDERLIEVEKTPEELLYEAGYILYECKNETEIQGFSKYYQPKERLCTFRGDRLDRCYVFFAVKKNVLEIDRNNYRNPFRQDEYGTSVISIQFTKGEVNTLSIKNRYNHIVSNPDATYSNNLENIIPGLTRSFEKYYDLNINQNVCGGFEIPGYVKAKDGKFYKYNYEINNIYYCPGNVIIDNYEVIDAYQEKEKYIIIDYFVLDLVNKKISSYDKSIDDCFVRGLENIKKIHIDKMASGNKILKITFEDNSYAFIEIDKCNRIIFYSNENIVEIGDRFLCKNKYLESIDVRNATSVGDNFLSLNNMLKEINLPNILKIGSDFLYNNNLIYTLNMSKLLDVGDNFLSQNQMIQSVNLVNLIKVGHNFLQKNNALEKIELPNLMCVYDRFLQYNKELDVLCLPNLICAGNNFLSGNKKIKDVFLPMLKQVGDNFLYCNKGLIKLNMKSLETTGNNFLYGNINIEMANLLNLREVGINCFHNNKAMVMLLAPKLEIVGNNFLYENSVLKYIDLSSLSRYGRCFCNNNKDIKKKILKI